jgi:hypothetical protein
LGALEDFGEAKERLKMIAGDPVGDEDFSP